MSFLTEIGNFAYNAARKVKNTVVGFVSGNNSSDDKKVNKDKPNAVVQQTNTGSYVDEFVKSQSGGEMAKNTSDSSSKNNKESVGSMRSLFENRCMACGADSQKIEKLLNIKSLSEPEKIKTYKAISESINLVIAMKAQGRFDEKTDIEAWVAFGVELKEEASLIPEEQKSNVYRKHLQKIDELLDSIQDAKNEKTVMQISEHKNTEICKEYITLINETQKDKKLTQKQKNAKILQLNNERRVLLKNLYLGITAVTGNNRNLIKSIRVVDSDDMDQAIKMGRETRKGKTEKTKFADAIKAKDITDLVDSYNTSYANMEGSSLLCNPSEQSNGVEMKGMSCGVDGMNGTNGIRKVSGNSVGRATSEAVVGKSYNGLNDFENDLMQIRDSVEQGNDDYKKEITRAMHSGVGAGTLLNTNLTDEQKVEFMNQWDNDARMFASSYEQVKSGCKELIQQYIQKYGKDNPELVEHLKALEKKIDEIIAKKETAEKAKTKEAEELEKEIASEKKSIETENKQKVDTTERKEEIGQSSVETQRVYTTTPVAVQGVSEIKDNKPSSVSQAETKQKSLVHTDKKFTHNTKDKSELSTPTSTSILVQNMMTYGYNSAPSGMSRLKVTLTNPILWQLYAKDTPRDLQTIGSINEILPTLNLCSTGVRIFVAEHINPKIKDDLIAELKKTSSQDFSTIIDAKENNNNKKKVEEKENAVA